MASLDPTLREPTPTGGVANRADWYRIAVALLRESGVEWTAADALDLAHYLAAGDGA